MKKLKDVLIGIIGVPLYIFVLIKEKIEFEIDERKSRKK